MFQVGPKVCISNQFLDDVDASGLLMQRDTLNSTDYLRRQFCTIE